MSLHKKQHIPLSSTSKSCETNISQTLENPRTNQSQKKSHKSVTDYESASPIMSLLTKDKSYVPKPDSEGYSVGDSDESDFSSSSEDNRDLECNMDGGRNIGCEELKRLKFNVSQVSSLKLSFSRKVLGKGAFSTVWYGKWNISPVAIKSIKLSSNEMTLQEKYYYWIR